MRTNDPIILIHAFPLDSAMWTPVAENLRAAGHTVHTPDLPGFGKRAIWPMERYSIEVLAEDIHVLILQQAGGHAIVGGCSVGGYILLSLLRHHPESVSAAMFFDTHPAADSPEAVVNRIKTIADVTSEGLAPLADIMAKRLLSPQTAPTLHSVVAAIIARQSTEGVIGLQYAMAKRSNQSDLLPKLKIPTLLIVGAEDHLTPPAMMQAMAEKFTIQPPPRLVVIPAAGHLAVLEQPELVSQALREFVQP
ncbi:MAG: alpha/beta fold hydrolase [Phycisphaerae bacterium]